jgi:hypothetical protein
MQASCYYSILRHDATPVESSSPSAQLGLSHAMEVLHVIRNFGKSTRGGQRRAPGRYAEDK